MMNIKGLTNHEAYLLKTLFVKAIKSRSADDALNECWDASGIAGRGRFEEFLVESGLNHVARGVTSYGGVKKVESVK